jgi:hypothetical protein
MSLPCRQPSRRQCNESPWPRGLTTSARERSRRRARFRHAVFHGRYRLEVRENRCQVGIGEILYIGMGMGGRISRPRPGCRPVRIVSLKLRTVHLPRPVSDPG